MSASKFMDKKITQLSKTHSFFDDEDDDDPYLFDQVAGSALVSAIDRRVKEHTDNVVHAVGALSGRVLQLERKTLKLENAIGELKDSIEFNHGRIEGKIRELGNVLGEVQGGIRDLRDKHDIAEAQLQLHLVKLELSKDDHNNNKSKTDKNSYIEIKKSQEMLSSSVPKQSYAQVSVPITCSQQLSSVPTGATHNLHQNTPSSQAAATAPQLPTPLPPSAFPSIPHTASTYRPAVLTPDNTSQQYLAPLDQQMQQPLPAAPQPYQPGYQNTQQSLALPEKEVIQPHFPTQHPPNTRSSQVEQQHPPNPQFPQLQQHPPNPQFPQLQQHPPNPQFSQLQQHPPNPKFSQLQQQHPPISAVNSHTNLPLCYQPNDVPYFPSQSVHNSSMPPPRSPAWQQNLDQSPISPFTEHPSGYSQPLGHTSLNNQYPYVACSSRYGGSTTKPSQPLPPSYVLGAEISSSSRLPTAKILPHAIPTASTVDSGSVSSESGNRVPVDDVIDKVVAMGFRRDLVRATVRKLTENGQSVDFNVVLDKLMNNSDG